MLNGAVKRLRTTNQLKEGMERVIIDQRKIIDLLPVYVETNFSDIINKSFFFVPHPVYLTHGVLKKARGNLEVSSPQRNKDTL